MARRDVFRNITETDANAKAPERKAVPGYTSRGASRNMLSSIGELAEKAARADQLIAGGVVTELNPDLIDASFVADRMIEDDEAFRALVAAIRDHGQDSPILVRPHPVDEGRFQVVFGHRRVRAARLLSRPVKAVVRPVSDVDHILAQGQENSARENLSFIERARFAQQLLDRGFERSVIQAALATDAPMVTRMLSVTSKIPAALIEAIGPAKTIGRDRWLELAQLVERPSHASAAHEISLRPDFSDSASDARFEMLLQEVKRVGRKTAAKPVKSRWQAADKAVSAEAIESGRLFSLALKSRDATSFGRFLTANLDRFYDQFKQETSD